MSDSSANCDYRGQEWILIFCGRCKTNIWYPVKELPIVRCKRCGDYWGWKKDEEEIIKKLNHEAPLDQTDWQAKKGEE